ncbi:MAG: DMT family transporter [Rhodospirillales bacterium]
MTAPQQRAGAGALATLAALALAWGCNWPFMKIVFAEFPVWTFRGASGLTAGVAVLALARLSGGHVRPEGARAWTWLWIAGLLNVTIWQVTTGYGVQLLGSGHAAVLAFTMPLWSGLIAWVALGEPVSGRFATALGMAMTGVALLSFRGGGFAAGDLPGIALMFAAAIAWAIGTLYAKRGRPDLPMLATVGWQIVLGSLPIALLAPLVEPLRWPQASLAAWSAAVYVTAVAMIVGYVAWFRLVGILPASVASLSTIAVPATAMLSGAVILGEALGPREIVALGLMLGALALVLILPALLSRRRAAPY